MLDAKDRLCMVAAGIGGALLVAVTGEIAVADDSFVMLAWVGGEAVAVALLGVGTMVPSSRQRIWAMIASAWCTGVGMFLTAGVQGLLGQGLVQRYPVAAGVLVVLGIATAAGMPWAVKDAHRRLHAAATAG